MGLKFNPLLEIGLQQDSGEDAAVAVTTVNGNVTYTGGHFRCIMGGFGGVVSLSGSSMDGLKGTIFRDSGGACGVDVSNGATILGFSGQILLSVGDCITVEQISQTEYVVIGANFDVAAQR